ncbi:YkvI family membrane protein [Flavonifractor hominis]|uniref:Membrane protein YkvI n=1 Tax=Flavonifractor hominis TaxID=3133178 RepID=A0ABV1EQK0_9FIRM
MKNNKISLATIIILSGAYLSFSVGASFGTGQELMQYFGSLGAVGILGLILSTSLTAVLVFIVSRDCRKKNIVDMNSMFRHYCGKYVGIFLRWYTVVMMFMFCGVMIAGGASTMNQNYGLDLNIGALIMMVVTVGTAMLGMKKLVTILGNIAPIILAGVLIICIYNIINPTDGLAAGNAALLEQGVELRISDNFVIAGLLQFSLVVLMAGSYVASVVTRPNTSDKEMIIGNISGQLTMMVIQIIMLTAFLVNGSIVGGTDVPVLMLAGRLGNAFSAVYGIILVLAIYTTVTGMDWIVASNLVPETNKWYRLVAVLVGVAAYVYSLFGSFTQLLNLVLTMSSYVGIIFIIGIVVTKIMDIVKGRNITSAQA